MRAQWLPSSLRAIAAGLLPVLIAACGSSESSRQHSAPASPLGGVSRAALPEIRAEAAITFFFERGCPDCERVREDLLPALLEIEGIAPEEVVELDVSRPDVAAEFLRLERRLGFRAESLAPTIVLRGRAYAGLESIESAVRGSRNTEERGQVASRSGES